MKRYRAVVAGLGGIGLGYDYEDASGARVQTHCRAFATHPGFELVGGADPMQPARARLEQQYKVPAFDTLPALLAATRPEVVAIAAPAHTHRTLVEQAIAARPRAILCEKPLAANGADGEAMVERAGSSGVLLAVNYIRRFDPGVATLRERIAGGELGEIYKGVVWYAKGLGNNGSSYLDLLDYLLGEAAPPELLAHGRRLDDGDFEPDFRIRIGPAQVYFLAGRHEHYTHGAVDLLGTRGRVQYERGGRIVRLWQAAPDDTFAGYTVLRELGPAAVMDVMRYQWHVADALHAALEGRGALASTGESALRALKTIDALRVKATTDE